MAHPATDIDVRHLETDSERLEEEVLIPKRPAPTPEQARLGIMPAAIGNGTFGSIMDPSRPRLDLDDTEFEAFERAIAENRAMRRQLAQERG